MTRASAGLSVFTILLLVLLGGGEAAHAQNPDTAATDAATGESTAMTGEGSGTATLTKWPGSLGELLDEMGRDAPYLLPKIDSLALDYRYAANDSTSEWSFVLGWEPGPQVLYEGDVLSRRSGPSNVRMTNIELRAQVRSEGRHVGDMIVAVDSMRLASFPSIYSFEVTVAHDRVFLDATTEEARRALADGATLDSLVVERMGFISASPSSSTRQRPDVQERGPTPRTAPSVYRPRSQIYIGWRVAPRPYYVGERNGQRTVTPRRETMGRGTTGAAERTRTTRQRASDDEDEQGTKTATGRPSSSEEEDDDDDDTSLQLPALGAMAAVGVVAYAGGTVGLYGRADTPIGLAAGYTQPSGGVQLHASINGAVVWDDPGQKLTLKALGFYDVFASRIQPAAGLGMQIDPSTEGEVSPAVSLGLAANFTQIVVFGGVDVVEGVPEIGVSYNFRHNGSTEEEK